MVAMSLLETFPPLRASAMPDFCSVGSRYMPQARLPSAGCPRERGSGARPPPLWPAAVRLQKGQGCSRARGCARVRIGISFGVAAVTARFGRPSRFRPSCNADGGGRSWANPFDVKVDADICGRECPVTGCLPRRNQPISAFSLRNVVGVILFTLALGANLNTMVISLPMAIVRGKRSNRPSGERGGLRVWLLAQRRAAVSRI